MDQYFIKDTSEQAKGEEIRITELNINDAHTWAPSRTDNATERTPFIDPEQTPNKRSLYRREKEPPSPRKNLYVYLLTCFAALGGFLFGYDTGAISAAMLLLRKVFNLSPLWQELIVSGTIFGAIMGALNGGWLTDKFGRRPTLLTAATTFVVGSLILSIAYHKEVLLVGRIVVGIAIGLESMAIPLYIAEAAPPEIRGTLVTINQIFITFGLFFSSIVGGLFSTDTLDGWRYMLGLPGIPAVIMWLGFLFLPESPRWLVKMGKVSKSRSVLIQIRGTSAIEEELHAIIAKCSEATLNGKEESLLEVVCRALKTCHTRRALIVGCGLQAIQQLSGINTVMYYSGTIIAMAGVSDQSHAIWLTTAVYFANFAFSFPSLWLIERLGRRKLTLCSVAGLVVGLFFIAGVFYFIKLESPKVGLHITNDVCSSYETCFDCVSSAKCGFCFTDIASVTNLTGNACLSTNVTNKQGRPSLCPLNKSISTQWMVNSCPSSYAWLAPLAMIFYLAMFAPGLGPIPWTVNAEIYPLWARSIGNACSTTTNWFLNFLVSLTFLHLMEYLSKPGTFLLYGGITIGSWIFIFLLLPETKGRSLEEVEQLFRGSSVIVRRKERDERLLTD